MRKVLIISYYYSDTREVATVRINGLAKFLPEFGWEPYILTSKLNPIQSSSDCLKVFGAPYEDKCRLWKRMMGFNENQGFKEQLGLSDHENKQDHIDLILKLWDEIFNYPDTLSNWRVQAVKLGELIIKDGIEAIISSSGPPTCNLIAHDLKKKYDIPWIADFRDLWTQNPYFQHTKIRHFFERRLEIKTLSCADAMITVSQPLSDKLKTLHPGKKVFCILNGFDPSQKNPGMPLMKKFTITYTGVLYKGKQDPEPLFQAIERLMLRGLLDPRDLSIEFYGPKESLLKDDVSRCGLSKIVRINGPISREESIEKQRRSHLLLLLAGNDEKEKGIYTGKLFDYLAAERPIISLGTTGGVVEGMLKITCAGYHASSQEEIEGVIINAYREYKSRNRVTYNGLTSEIDKFSHIEMARKFAAVLDDIAESRIRNLNRAHLSE